MLEYFKKIYLKMGIGIMGVVFICQFVNLALFGIIYLGSLFFLYKQVEQKSNKRFLWTITIVSFAVRFLIIIIMPTAPQSDFAVLYNAAVALLDGENTMINSAYFIRWGYQTGPVMYLYCLLKIYNEIFFVKIVNVLWTIMNIHLIYRITKLISSERSSRIVTFAYMEVCSWFEFKFIRWVYNRECGDF